MREILYLDVYFVLNVLLDAVSLAAAGLCTGEKTRFARLVTASLSGGVFCVVPLFLPLSQRTEALLGLAMAIPMIWIAFGKRNFRRFGMLTLFFWLTAFVLGGVVQFLSDCFLFPRGEEKITLGIFLALIFFTLGAWQLWGKRMKQRLDSCIISLCITYRGVHHDYFALVDSGSFVSDPISGDPVILMKADAALLLLGEEMLESIRQGSAETVPISVKTASGRCVLFAFRPTDICVGTGFAKKRKKNIRALIALDFSGGAFAGCPCLVPLRAV